jgi:hypothetical protein
MQQDGEINNIDSFKILQLQYRYNFIYTKKNALTIVYNDENDHHVSLCWRLFFFASLMQHGK